MPFSAVRFWPHCIKKSAFIPMKTLFPAGKLDFHHSGTRVAIGVKQQDKFANKQSARRKSFGDALVVVWRVLAVIRNC
jgi:hypothetical protein